MGHITTRCPFAIVYFIDLFTYLPLSFAITTCNHVGHYICKSSLFHSSQFPSSPSSFFSIGLKHMKFQIFNWLWALRYIYSGGLQCYWLIGIPDRKVAQEARGLAIYALQWGNGDNGEPYISSSGCHIIAIPI